jgi:tetratricopeptide (TPR) repeat protein
MYQRLGKYKKSIYYSNKSIVCSIESNSVLTAINSINNILIVAKIIKENNLTFNEKYILKNLNKIESDSLKVKSLKNIFDYYRKVKPDKYRFKRIISKLQALYFTTKDYKIRIIINNIKAKFKESIGESNNVVLILKSNYRIYKTHNNIEGITEYHSLIGSFYNRIGLLSKSRYYLTKALKTSKINSFKLTEAIVSTNLALLYIEMKIEYKKQSELLNNAIQIFSVLKIPHNIEYCKKILNGLTNVNY